MGGLSPASEVHPVGGPNAPVSPHARGAHSEAKLPALPIQVSKSWKSAPRPSTVAVVWFAVHVASHKLGVGLLRCSALNAVGVSVVQSLSHVATLCPQPMTDTRTTARATRGRRMLAMGAHRTRGVNGARRAPRCIRGCAVREAPCRRFAASLARRFTSGTYTGRTEREARPVAPFPAPRRSHVFRSGGGSSADPLVRSSAWNDSRSRSSPTWFRAYPSRADRGFGSRRKQGKERRRQVVGYLEEP